MKNFFAVFLSSLLGVIISTVLVGLIFVFSIVGAFKEALSGKDNLPVTVESNSIIRLTMDGMIKERSGGNPFSGLNFNDNEKISLDAILLGLKKAKTDSSVKGIYLELKNTEAGFATCEEIRNALLDFRAGGKFVIAYAEMFSQKSYYLATAADKIYLNPQGGIELKGLSAQLMFYKKALENMNVEVQIFKHGKFKSAVEPFFLDKMSEPNRLQTQVFMNSIWNAVMAGISKQRNISVDDLNKMADNLVIRNPQDALDKKLVDGLMYEDEVMKLLREKTGKSETEKINFISLKKYRKAVKNMNEDGEDTDDKKDARIAVIYAVGSIESGKGDDETIGSERIAGAIREARLDSTVKAIVLRVNSPGGSALASDVMWREVMLAKKVKPFIVSMGDVAASGGYYISCAADRIFAQPNTITGSIGVFGIMPNAQKLLSEKLGISIDTVNTNKHSDVGTLYRGVTEDERQFIQQGVEDVYQVFISRVAEGRKLSVAEVDSLGQGRVWSGTDALQKKLVDELGGLEKAVKYAASKANLKEDNYSLTAFPKKSNPFDMFLKDMEGDVESKILSNKLGEQYMYIQQMKYLINAKGVQARMPFDYIIY